MYRENGFVFLELRKLFERYKITSAIDKVDIWKLFPIAVIYKDKTIGLE